MPFTSLFSVTKKYPQCKVSCNEESYIEVQTTDQPALRYCHKSPTLSVSFSEK